MVSNVQVFSLGVGAIAGIVFGSLSSVLLSGLLLVMLQLAIARRT